jgi:hypothetical protein
MCLLISLRQLIEGAAFLFAQRASRSCRRFHGLSARPSLAIPPARRRVIDGTDYTGLRQHIVVFDKQHDHEANDFTRCEMFASRFV